MFGLIRNIDFDLASIVMVIILLITTKFKYNKVSRANRSYFRILIVLLVSLLLEIFLTFSMTYKGLLPTWVIHLFRCIFNMVNIMIAYMTYWYVRAYQQVEGRKKIVEDYIVGISTLLFLVISLVDFPTGIMTWFDEEGNYYHGSFYFLIYVSLAIVVLMFIVSAVKNRVFYTKYQFVTLWLGFVFTCSFIVLELCISSSILISLFGTTISVIIIQFSLESPEYSKLLESKEQAENARIEADMANLAKSDFLARMSHEIRTPMNAVLGMNEMIMNTTKEKDTKIYASDAYTAAYNLLDVINDILDFSKIESGKVTLNYDRYSLTEVLRELWTMFSLKTREKKLELDFVVDKNIPDEFFGDAQRLRQILTNLLNNAVKYTEKGKVMLRISLSERVENGAELKFEVIDTGRGIKKEDMHLLFEAFERIDEINSSKIEGTGLGINISAALLGLMNSELKVESQVGEGSNFYFYLRQAVVSPAIIGDYMEADFARFNVEAVSLKAMSGKILIVDDIALNLKVFKAFLKDSGFEIETAESGREALEMTLKNKYDLILMDYLMPEMDGIECFEAIKSQKDGLNNDTPEIVLTANAIKGAYEEYIGKGFKEVLFKPYTKNQIIEVINRFLG